MMARQVAGTKHPQLLLPYKAQYQRHPSPQPCCRSPVLERSNCYSDEMEMATGMVILTHMQAVFSQCSQSNQMRFSLNGNSSLSILAQIQA